MAEAPLSAEEIAHRGFPSTFRGFDPAEVRAYLVRVSNELKAAAARERDLKQKLIEAERLAANPVIDQAMLTRALGEETSRVLVSAQEAARQLQARAEDGVARILREAHEQAQRIRAEAEVVLADRTEEADTVAGEIRVAAQAEAAAVVEQARREGEAARAEVVEQSRQLVHEAQAARARVLGDLTRRRRIAHTQVEQLRAGRERLLDAYRVVRRTLDEVADELERVESEARTAAGAAARRVEAALDAGDVPTVEDDGAGAEAVGLPAEAPGDVSASVAPGAPAPASAATVVAQPPEEEASSPVEGVELAAVPPLTRKSPPGGKAPIVAREERVEERKLSSLRILRRPKPDAPSISELKVVDAPSEVEGVRVILASTEEDEQPPPPAPVPGVREQPSVMPGVSWAPAPSASPPAPPEPAPAEPAEAAAGSRDEPAPTAVEDLSPPTPEQASQVEALFARIRADRAASVVTPDEGVVPPAQPAAASTDDGALAPAGAVPGSAPEPSAEPAASELVAPSALGQEETLLQRRDEAIEAIEAALTRKLKRALQDEHNDVLDRLRSCKGIPSVTVFLPPAADQAARYASAVGDLLAEVARSGAKFVASGQSGSQSESGSHSPEVADVVADLTESLVGPLRRDVERGVESGQDDAAVLVDVIGAAYRECKTQRLERLAADATIAAFSRGTVSASSGSELRWIVDDGDAACPDCDDNALAGPTASGQHYPTGQPHPPAHAGCRCLLVPGHP
ncbi:MAG TPA: DivIVA domain-containing protein [Acidimicrobiales bacterium]|nr:DivIVA domain-containing protein [Acidimicrobiales bacterium]